MKTIKNTIVLACTLWASQALGFWVVTDASHQGITKQALKNYVYSLGDSPLIDECATCTFKPIIRRLISLYNEDVDGSTTILNFDGIDKWGTNPARHCDDEKFSECSLIIRTYKKQIAEVLKNTINNPSSELDYNVSYFREERKKLGYAFHTLQDFYSHSNWVEISMYGANKIILNDGFNETFGTASINEELYTSSYYPSLSEGHACVTGPEYENRDAPRYNELFLDRLTSGYYHNNSEIYDDDAGEYCNVPSLVNFGSNVSSTCETSAGNIVGLGYTSKPVDETYNGPYFNSFSKEKCIHGSKLQEGTILTPKSYVGIAKDHPGKMHHDQALSVAISATTAYVEAIVEDVKRESGVGVYTDWAILMFLGYGLDVPSPEPPSEVSSIINGGAIDISFKKSQGAEEYFLYRKSPNSELPEKIDTSVSGSGLSFSDSTAELGIEYCYYVSASNNIGESEARINAVCRTIGSPEIPVCEGGNCQDDRGNPTKSATAMGDPHLRTFDGLIYDFQGVGEYILVKSDDGDLEIQTRTQPWGNRSNVSLNSAIVAKVGDDRVGFYRAEVGLAVFVSGELIELDEGYNNLSSGGLVYRDGNVYTVAWPDQSQMKVSRRSDFIEVNVSLNPARQGTVSGLLGYFDGTLDSELQTSDGQTFDSNAMGFTDLYDVFGESWRVDEQTTLFEYFDAETLEGFVDRNFPSSLLTLETVRQRLGDIEYERLVSLCQQFVSLPARVGACVIDVAITGIEDGLDAYQRIAKPDEAVNVQAPPLVTITTPEAGSIQSSNVTIRGAIGANASIISVELSINGGARTDVSAYFIDQNFVFSLPSNNLIEGNNQIIVYAGDENGNIGNGIIYFIYDSSVAPEAGGDLIVVNDVNMFDDSHIGNADNIQFVKNLINFTGDTPRSSGSKVLWDSSHASRCDNCVVTTSFRSTLVSEGFVFEEVTLREDFLDIAPEVKLLILWTPTIAFNASEIGRLKTFASEGGRILFVGENQGYYGQVGLTVENQFLEDMGALMRNLGETTFSGKTTLQVSLDNKHQTMMNVSEIQVNLVSLIDLGPNDYPLLTSSDGSKVIAGVARINVNQLTVNLLKAIKKGMYKKQLPPSPIVYQNPGSSL